MAIATVKDFFMWCTILNVALLAFSALFLSLANAWVYKMHTRSFPLSREAFNAIIYSFLGLYKVLIIVFNLVPYLALSILS